MKRLLLPLLAALALPTAVSSHETQTRNAHYEALTGGSILSICKAHYLNYISDKNTESMLGKIYNTHLKVYYGSKQEAIKSYNKLYLVSLEQYPECNSRAFKLKRD